MWLILEDREFLFLKVAQILDEFHKQLEST